MADAAGFGNGELGFPTGWSTGMVRLPTVECRMVPGWFCGLTIGRLWYPDIPLPRRGAGIRFMSRQRQINLFFFNELPCYFRHIFVY